MSAKIYQFPMKTVRMIPMPLYQVSYQTRDTNPRVGVTQVYAYSEDQVRSMFSTSNVLSCIRLGK
jgi:hypothetical protein